MEIDERGGDRPRRRRLTKEAEIERQDRDRRGPTKRGRDRPKKEIAAEKGDEQKEKTNGKREATEREEGGRREREREREKEREE